MPRVYVGLGSNLNRSENLKRGLAALEAEFGTLQVSQVYESAAFGFDGAPFFNMAAGFDTSLGVAELNRRLKAFEDACGRVLEPRSAPKSLDIDLLLYGEQQGCIEGVELPRAEITRNAYVLCPLAELLPDGIDPVSGKSYAYLWACFDKGFQPLESVQLSA